MIQSAGLFLLCIVLFAWAGYAPERTERRSLRFAFATGRPRSARRDASPKRSASTRRGRKAAKAEIPAGGEILAAEFGAVAEREVDAEAVATAIALEVETASEIAPPASDLQLPADPAEEPGTASGVDNGGEPVEQVEEFSPPVERPDLSEEEFLRAIPPEPEPSTATTAADDDSVATKTMPGGEPSPATRLDAESDTDARALVIRGFASREGEEGRSALIDVAMFATASADRALAIELLAEMGELDAVALALNDADKGVAVAAALAVCNGMSSDEAATLLRSRVSDELRATELVTIVRAFAVRT